MGEPKPQFDVFISYAKKRHRLTAGLANDLKAAGFSCWWDTRMLAGESFNAVIDQQLEACRRCRNMPWPSAPASALC